MAGPDHYHAAGLAAMRRGDDAKLGQVLELAVAAALGERAETAAVPHSGRNEAYLTQKLELRDGRLVDAAGEAVMMGWELPLMRASAAALSRSCANLDAPRLLNVGFGLGLIDEALQSAFKGRAAEHTILEAHPDVLAHARSTGWADRHGVRLLPGRWQTSVPALVEAGESFDAIFYDTYAESYADLRRFMAHLPSLLSSRRGACFAYFNGVAAEDPFFHGVYCQLAQHDIAHLPMSAGRKLKLEFEVLRIGDLDDVVWEGLPKRYWRNPWYLAPLASSIGANAKDETLPEFSADVAPLLVREHLAASGGPGVGQAGMGGGRRRRGEGEGGHGLRRAGGEKRTGNKRLNVGTPGSNQPNSHGRRHA